VSLAVFPIVEYGAIIPGKGGWRGAILSLDLRQVCAAHSEDTDCTHVTLVGGVQYCIRVSYPDFMRDWMRARA
jgi:hypothetical protein